MTSSMSASGSGTGSTMGPSTPAFQRELETSAWAATTKAALGIVKDSIDQAFILNNPRYNFGYLGGFGYRSTAGNPLLDHPLESLRLYQSGPPSSANFWQAIYDELLNHLPPELKTELKNTLSRPIGERDAAFVILNEILSKTAYILASLNILSQPVDSASLEAARTTLNLILPYTSLQATVLSGSEFGALVQEWVTEWGANELNADVFMHTLIDMQTSLRELRDIQETIKNRERDKLELEADERKIAEKAADRLRSLEHYLEQNIQDDKLSSLQAMIKTSALVADALSLPRTESATLFMGLSIASIGLDTSESSSGLVSPTFAAMIDSSVNSLLPEGNAASKQLLSLLMTFGSLATVGIATALNAPFEITPSSSYSFALGDFLGVGAGSFLFGVEPQGWLTSLLGISLITCLGWLAHLNDDSPEKQIAPIQAFAFSTTLQMIASSGFFNAFCKEALATCGANEKMQMTGSEALAQALHLILLLAGTRGSRQAPEELVEEIEKYLAEGVSSAEALAADEEVSIRLKQALTALEEKDYNNFLVALNDLLERAGSSSTALLKEIDQLRSTAKEILNCLSSHEDAQPITSIVQLA